MIQLLSLLVTDLLSQVLETSSHTMVITSDGPVPFTSHDGEVSRMPDMRTTQEKADTILIRQIYQRQNTHKIAVISDDTDVFTLLLHFVNQGKITCPVLMASLIEELAIIDINCNCSITCFNRL